MGRDALTAQLAAAGVLPMGASPAVAAMQLDPVPLAPGLARRFIDSHLAQVSATQREAASLLTSELVTSVVLHARTSLEVGVATIEGDVVLAVSDHDPPKDAPDSLRGRSKALVAALADDYGTMSQPRCHTIWLLLRAQGRANSAGTIEAASARA